MQTSIHKDLVLIGGGHSHIAVLKSFGMRPIPGVRLTLISRTTETPYSGMLPGLIAGYYTFDEAHIDLRQLCRFARARFFCGEVSGIDRDTGTITVSGRPLVSYDIVSINAGSTPSMGTLTDTTGLTPVKPVDRFLPKWERILTHARSQPQEPIRIAVVGAGAGGVEVALAIHARLASEGVATTLTLISDTDDVLPTHNAGVRRRLRRCLESRGIALRLDTRVVTAANGRLFTADGDRYDFDEVIWTTHASAPQWIEGSGLQVDDAGFLVVDRHLRSISDSNVFGAGDIATVQDARRPKSGVFAVRQGPPLSQNLRRALCHRRLRPYLPQRRFLSLIGTSDGSAIASRGSLALQGRWVWRWKEWIDRRFMQRFQDLPSMPADNGTSVPAIPPEVIDDESFAATADTMRCGGCGAKVGATVLEAALRDLPVVARKDVIVGLDAPDDAAILSVPEHRLIAASVDAFRPMIDDPYTFGKIAANHCLNDLFAMGAEPQAALAIVSLPVWPERKLTDELRQMLTGAHTVFTAAGVALVGGHTSEAAEISLGFSVTGLVSANLHLGKTGVRAGDRLILTKGIGTGVIMAADMRGKARGRWVDAALESMVLSNAAAGRILLAHGTHACTDVTGFGIFGHLVEMAGPHGAVVELDLDSLPLIEGALDALELGFRSTMQPKNERLLRRAAVLGSLSRNPVFALLFDPQTAGGLIASVPADQADACLDELHECDYPAAAVVGKVLSVGGGRLELAARMPS